MRTLHNIQPSDINYWVDKEGNQILFGDIDNRHLNNILTRYATKYVKGLIRGEREKMFEGAVLEWNRRFGRFIL